MVEKSKPESDIPELAKSFEDWAAEKKLEDWVIAGVITFNGWASGKELYEKEYNAAVKKWLGSKVGEEV